MAKSKSKSNGSKLVNVISWILLIVILLGSVGLAAYFTDGFTNDITSFYVQDCAALKYDKKNNREIVLENDTDTIFNCVYPMSVFSKKFAKNFDVKVVANKASDFNYYINDTLNSFALSNADFSQMFNITKSATGFTINVPKSASAHSIISAAHAGSKIKIDTAPDTHEVSYFMIVITPYNGKNAVNIPIKFYSERGIEDITLDNSGIVIGESGVIK